MIKGFERAYIRRMAKIYREQNWDMSIGMAVKMANQAYETYKEAEMEIMYEEYERT